MSNGPIIATERVQEINGQKGRYLGATVGGSNYREGTFTRQRWIASKRIPWGQGEATFTVRMRFDDDCRNGYNTFALTAEVRRDRARDIDAGGCMHDEIAEHFPGLAPLIRWHLMSTDGPMHYVANTVYLASDLDHNGKRKGEPTLFQDFVRFGTSPVRHALRPKFAKWLQDPDVRLDDLEVIRVDHKDHGGSGAYQFAAHYTFGGYDASWGSCPFKSEAEALEWAEALSGEHEFVREATQWSKGGERDFDAARRSAIWPDATDEELSAEPKELRVALEARLPDLIAEFRADMESCGFLWAPPVTESEEG